MEVQVSTGQLLLATMSSNALLVGVVVYLAKRFGPELFGWMKGKIDTKNGQIGELVEEVKRLSSAMCELVRQGNQRQDQFMCDMREICATKDQQIEALMAELKTALKRTA